MTEAELDELIDRERGPADRRAISAAVGAGVDRELHDLRVSIQATAQAFRTAGVPPPPWMEDAGWYGGFFTVTKWLAENITPGPDGAKVLSATQQVRSALEALEKIGNIERL